ncbi:hypothetical protein [Spirosoma endophyticum]|uniref:Uncharacterized protein n=1 Tax=Spirosoma endophyticum TaxID=662367 RepID=A0A1I2GD55_9BACT|nr:hypothetical protein [Spirosoma endophyticum]SFF15113.1 hypothetical protein SAMN05216167_13127 [Spirosoma endophyticum]
MEIAEYSTEFQTALSLEYVEIKNKFSAIASQLLEKKSQQKQTHISTLDEYKTFFEKFLTLIVNPVIEASNLGLSSSGSKFDTFTYEGESVSFFCTYVVFHENESSINLLADPYLIIEGYPDTNEIRIAEAKSASRGRTLQISDLNDSAIIEYRRIISSDLMKIAKHVIEYELV